ncbi:phosphoglycerate dehydrogenase-like enzyme [Rhodococcus sp. SORGH_AS 301]|nr:phosphoglycerate dehydrogenase-like enzyme [Rhodococcus sp. SORGH_AS_0301]
MSPSRTNGGARPILTVLHDGLLPDRVQELDTSYEVRHATADTFGDAVDGAQAVLLWDFFSSALRDQWSRCSALEWVHVAAAGVDKLLFDDLAASDVVVTNARGVFDVPIAEFVLASVLALAKDVRGTVELGRQARWLRRETENIAGRRALVIGTGSIGRATARMLRAVGMDVAGVGRTARTGDADFGTVHASSDLASVVPGADYLVLIAPLTPVDTGHGRPRRARGGRSRGARDQRGSWRTARHRRAGRRSAQRPRRGSCPRRVRHRAAATRARAVDPRPRAADRTHER